MANERGKKIDTTFLSLDHAEERGFLHRDYLAHCLRWSHVTSYLNQSRRYQSHHVLDVGCGREAPLAKLLFSSRMTHTTGSYTGVDYGKLERPSTIAEGPKFKGQFLGKFDFAKDKLPRTSYDTIACFEMLEHVEPMHSFRTLQRIRQLLAKDGRAFISTPCYDPKMGAAANHVNEMSWLGLQALIEAAGLTIEAAYGTFASQKDYKKLMSPAQTEVFDQLNEYYDSNVLSCLMAPMFPKQARNCLWRLTPGKPKPISKETLKQLQDPKHSNSHEWSSDLAKIQKEVK